MTRKIIFVEKPCLFNDIILFVSSLNQLRRSAIEPPSRNFKNIIKSSLKHSKNFGKEL
tara:strand:- start:8463 stop:8636 length:174 start_codon:yes stop_codon:yes gene_type:complete